MFILCLRNWSTDYWSILITLTRSKKVVALSWSLNRIRILIILMITMILSFMLLCVRIITVILLLLLLIRVIVLLLIGIGIIILILIGVIVNILMDIHSIVLCLQHSSFFDHNNKYDNKENEHNYGTPYYNVLHSIKLIRIIIRWRRAGRIGFIVLSAWVFWRTVTVHITTVLKAFFLAIH